MSWLCSGNWLTLPSCQLAERSTDSALLDRHDLDFPDAPNDRDPDIEVMPTKQEVHGGGSDRQILDLHLVDKPGGWDD